MFYVEISNTADSTKWAQWLARTCNPEIENGNTMMTLQVYMKGVIITPCPSLRSPSDTLNFPSLH